LFKFPEGGHLLSITLRDQKTTKHHHEL